MKSLLGIVLGAAILYAAPSLAHSNGNSSGSGAESNPVGPFVQCQLPDKTVEFMPAFYCELKKGKYHY